MAILTLFVSLLAVTAIIFVLVLHGDGPITIAGLGNPFPTVAGPHILRFPPPPDDDHRQEFSFHSPRPIMGIMQGRAQDGGGFAGQEQALPSASPGEPLPFVVLHGISDQCSNDGVSMFVDTLNRYVPGADGLCLHIGNGVEDSWLMPMRKQVDIACKSIKRTPRLRNGFNLIGLSQGCLLGRAYIEWCTDGPPVHNYIAIAGPNAGTAAVPLCTDLFVCYFVNLLLQLGMYTKWAQNHVAPTGYVKIPSGMSSYLRGSRFLPYLNNEHRYARKRAYAHRFASLNRLVLIMFEQDRVIIPKETAWFGWYLPEDSVTRVVPVNETRLYKEDLIGLRSLDEAGKVVFVALPGGHLQLTHAAIRDYVVPYLIMNSSSHSPR